MGYLHPETAALLDRSDNDRIAHIRDKKIWVNYPRVQEISEHLKLSAKSAEVQRPMRLAIVGHTGSGKSHLVEHFFKSEENRHKAQMPDDYFPIVLIQQPPEPRESRLYESILEAVRVPFRASDNTQRKLRQVMSIFKTLGIRLLIIDDIHDALKGSLLAQRQYLAVLRYLLEVTKISLVVAGTEPALQFLDHDEQIRRRFEFFDLPRFQSNNQFRSLLKSFELRLPLKHPSNLSDPELANLICISSDGLVGSVAKMLEKATIYAIKSGIEKIDRNVIERCGWVPLSEKTRAVGAKLA